MLKPVIDIPAAGSYGFQRFHQLHRSNKHGISFRGVNLAVHQRHPVGNAPVAPFVVLPPDGIVPVFIGDGLTRLSTKHRLAGIAVTGAGIPCRKFALVVPDAVGVITHQHFAHNLDNVATVILGVGARHIVFADLAKIAVVVT